MAHAQMMVFLASANLSVWSVFVTGEFKKTTTATATGTLLNRRFNEQSNGCARALEFLVHFAAVLSKTRT